MYSTQCASNGLHTAPQSEPMGLCREACLVHVSVRDVDHQSCKMALFIHHVSGVTAAPPRSDQPNSTSSAAGFQVLHSLGRCCWCGRRRAVAPSRVARSTRDDGCGQGQQEQQARRQDCHWLELSWQGALACVCRAVYSHVSVLPGLGQPPQPVPWWACSHFGILCIAVVLHVCC